VPTSEKEIQLGVLAGRPCLYLRPPRAAGLIKEELESLLDVGVCPQ